MLSEFNSIPCGTQLIADKVNSYLHILPQVVHSRVLTVHSPDDMLNRH